jgi:NAD-dependent histone deacetylase SIR2
VVSRLLSYPSHLILFQGAGISVQAGIPDFRSSDGLFQSIKRKEAMSSGKELFDVSVFNVRLSLFLSPSLTIYPSV